MTAIYKIPEPTSVRFRFRSKPVKARAIKVVIPTYKDWDGLRVTLDSLLRLKTPPKKIAVANDNEESEMPEWLEQYPIDVINYAGNLRPARARNKGFGLREEIPPEKLIGALLKALDEDGKLPNYVRNGTCPELKYRDFDKEPNAFEWNSDIDWVYFTDCGCTHTPDLFLRFEEAWQECGDCCVAICGPVTGSGKGTINEYMTEQGVLNAPRKWVLGSVRRTEEGFYQLIDGSYLPQAIVTANTLVAALPFAFLGGFDPAFPEAAGEDLDLGIRLREFGVITYNESATVSHRFDEDDADFYRRFRRYGRGNRRLELKHALPSLRPTRPFEPDKKNDPEHLRLATLSYEAMCVGYDEEVKESDRGVLRVICP